MLTHVLKIFSLHLLNQLACPNNTPSTRPVQTTYLAPGRRVYSNDLQYREGSQPQLLTVSMDDSGSLWMNLTVSMNDLHMQHAPMTISLARCAVGSTLGLYTRSAEHRVYQPPVLVIKTAKPLANFVHQNPDSLALHDVVKRIVTID